MNLLNIAKIALVALFVPLAAQTAQAADAVPAAPDALVRQVTEEVLTIVRTDKTLQSGDQKRAMELVDTVVLPHFNFSRMTSLAVGRDWRQATPEQQQQLIAEFRTLLVRTYSNALTAYKNQSVDYRPFRMGAGDTDVIVRTLVNQPGGKPIQLDYNLEKQDNTWKVYDVIVAGVSLVTNYRTTFSSEIRAGGIDGLIKTLQTKNNSLETSALAQTKK